EALAETSAKRIKHEAQQIIRRAVNAVPAGETQETATRIISRTILEFLNQAQFTGDNENLVAFNKQVAAIAKETEKISKGKSGYINLVTGPDNTIIKLTEPQQKSLVKALALTLKVTEDSESPIESTFFTNQNRAGEGVFNDYQLALMNGLEGADKHTLLVNEAPLPVLPAPAPPEPAPTHWYDGIFSS
ncbi:hypothetical protein DID80_07835, partial [Candidatus Marinamargulisbacteria bacterium SCGC AAA071-K20]